MAKKKPRGPSEKAITEPRLMRAGLRRAMLSMSALSSTAEEDKRKLISAANRKDIFEEVYKKSLPKYMSHNEENKRRGRPLIEFFKWVIENKEIIMMIISLLI